MKLYSIWHTGKQRFWKGDYWNGTQHWGKTPRYWQTIDGVRTNLTRIGSEYRGTTDSLTLPRNRANLEGESVFNFKRYANFDPSNLAEIEVIVTDVEVFNENRFSASKMMEAIPA
jgi:hypothetical protein